MYHNLGEYEPPNWNGFTFGNSNLSNKYYNDWNTKWKVSFDNGITDSIGRHAVLLNFYGRPINNLNCPISVVGMYFLYYFYFYFYFYLFKFVYLFN